MSLDTVQPPFDLLQLSSLSQEDVPAVLEAVYCRQELNRIAAQAPACCEARALVADEPPAGSKHYRKAVCGSCGKFFGWISKPKNLARRAPSTLGLSPGAFCVLCLAGEGLETHHIIEVQDGGSNAPENRLTVCAGCHALIHWLRRYRTPAEARAA